MKSRFRLFGAIALVALAGFSMAACTNPVVVIELPDSNVVTDPASSGVAANTPHRAVPQPDAALTLQNMTNPGFNWAPLIMASYSTGEVNRYVIRAGVVEYAFIQELSRPTWFDGTPLSMAVGQTSSESIRQNVRTTNAQTVRVLNETGHALTLGGSVGVRGKLFNASVSTSYTFSERRGVENITHWEVQTDYETIRTHTDWQSVTFHIAGNRPHGYYRIAVYARMETFFVVETSRDRRTLLDMEVVVVPTGAFNQLDFSPTLPFDNRPVVTGAFIDLYNHFYRNLPYIPPPRYRFIGAEGQSLAYRLNLWRNIAQNDGNYVIQMSGNESLAQDQLSLMPRNARNATLTLVGSGTGLTVSLAPGAINNGSLFTIPSGITLALNNVTLQGRGGNTAALVRINGGILEMNARSIISGNTGSGGSAGGVDVNNSGTLVMRGGTITGNTGGRSSINGGIGGAGGVNINSGGRFVMYTGTIERNTGGVGGTGFAGTNGANGSSTSTWFARGGSGGNGAAGGHGGRGGAGGVNIDQGSSFVMRGGEITANTGGQGGTGGRGGNGGNGGSGGFLGSTGNGGNGGRGGNGGSGGNGGMNNFAGGSFDPAGGLISGNNPGPGGVRGNGGTRGQGGSAGSDGAAGTPGNAGGRILVDIALEEYAVDGESGSDGDIGGNDW